MAAPIPVAANSLWEVRLNGFVDGEQLINTWHYINLDPQPDVIPATLELATEFGIQHWTARIKQALSTSYEFAYIDAQAIRPVRYRSQRYIPASRTGTIAGDCSPSGVAVVVRRTTALAGRRNQGRVYLGGIAESTTVQSGVTTGWLATNKVPLEEAMTESVILPVGGEFLAVLYHPGPVTAADEIILAKVDISIRYQRRREVGVGI